MIKPTETKELPENIRQALDLIAAVLKRIKETGLDKSRISCLHIAQQKGAAV